MNEILESFVSREGDIFVLTRNKENELEIQKNGSLAYGLISQEQAEQYMNRIRYFYK